MVDCRVPLDKLTDRLSPTHVVADEQLDELEASDPGPHNEVLTVCELVFAGPGQSMSSAIQTNEGIVLRLAVPGRPPHKVFWKPDGPRIEVVPSHP